jgi:hypothetical protein
MGSVGAWTVSPRREQTCAVNARLLAVLFFAASSASAAATPKPASAPAKPAAAATTPPAAAQKPTAPPGQALPGTPVSLAGRDQVDPSVPEKYRDEVRSAQLEGARLQQEDFAVWVASNALVQSGIRAPGTATGWIATAKDAGAQAWTVAFTVKEGNKQLVYADVGVDLTKPPPKLDFVPRGKGRELSADENILVSARDSISHNKDWLRCADDYNYSVSFRQGKKGRETVVRALPARHDQKLYLLGGFHEFTGPDKGGKQKQFHQTNTCIEVTLPPHGTGFVVSHLRSKTPTLFHVFANLSYERPVHVKIDGKTWKVDGGRITLLDKESVKSLKTEAPPSN